MRGDQQGALVGEVAVCGRSGDRCDLGGLFDGGRPALREQLARRIDQSGTVRAFWRVRPISSYEIAILIMIR
jgi:hypothetical protein